MSYVRSTWILAAGWVLGGFATLCAVTDSEGWELELSNGVPSTASIGSNYLSKLVKSCEPIQAGSAWYHALVDILAHIDPYDIVAHAHTTPIKRMARRGDTVCMSVTTSRDTLYEEVAQTAEAIDKQLDDCSMPTRRQITQTVQDWQLEFMGTVTQQELTRRDLRNVNVMQQHLTIQRLKEHEQFCRDKSARWRITQKVLGEVHKPVKAKAWRSRINEDPAKVMADHVVDHILAALLKHKQGGST